MEGRTICRGAISNTRIKIGPEVLGSISCVIRVDLSTVQVRELERFVIAHEGHGGGGGGGGAVTFSVPI
jgi:hypothetical protein